MTRKIRAFSPMKLSEGEDELLLGEEESHHLGKVLRIQSGSMVEILDGRGSLAEGEVTKVDRKATRVRISKRKFVPPPNPFIRIGVAMTKANRGEELIRPLTEMGVGGIIPLFTERTEVRISTDKVMGKLAKWEKLAVEACKQSGNPWLPEIEAPIKFGELSPKKEQACFIASLRSRSGKSLPTLESPTSEFLLFIGPEGGWTEREEEIASDKGAVPFSLGPNVLRSETAALCALAVARAGFLD